MTNKNDSDLETVKELVGFVLEKYNCEIVYDDELKSVMIVDNDTQRFEDLEG